MLSRTSKEEVLRRLEATVGHPITEEKLSPGMRQALLNLSVFQRHLGVISEIVNGEEGRIEHNAFLVLISKVRKDRVLDAHAKGIQNLQAELAAKISEISLQIIAEEKATLAGQPLPERSGGIEAVELKCPSCGAALPMPTGRFVRCQYCNASLTIEDVSDQIRTLIRNV